MRRYLSNQCALGVALSIAATSFSPTTFSQTESALLEEVVVTARKREESLAETPLAITAISAQEIKAANFKNIIDVQKTSPGLFMESMNNENGRTILMPRFRGVTFDATSPLQRTSSVFVDGLVVSSGLHSLPITQVERIEVIKGPQSALFGRNTYSGAINIVTARPGDELKGSVEVDFGSRSKASANGFIEGPISDSIGARLTWSYVNKEGHYDNSLVDGQRLGDEKSTAVGVMFDINPSENLNIMVRASQYEDDDGPGAYAVVGGLADHNYCAQPTTTPITSWGCFEDNGLESVYRGSVRAPDTLGASTSSSIFGFATEQLRGEDGNWAGIGGGPGYAPIGDHSFDDLSHNGFGKFGTGDRLGIIVSYDISDSMSFDMRYGSNEDDYVLFHDFDASPTWGFHTYNARVTKDDSFEMQLSGEAENFDWSVGYTKVEMSSKAHGGFYDEYFGQFSGRAGYWFADIRNPLTAFSMIEANTTGIYGSIDYRFTDKLTLIAEVRRQEDEVDDPNVNADAGKTISPGEFKSTLPRLVLKYDISDTTMMYLNYSEGTLPGGFNPEVASKLTTPEQISTFNSDTPGIAETYGEETLKNFELGWKMSSEDGSFSANAAIYHMERSDQIYSGFGVIPADANCSGVNEDGSFITETCTVAFSGNGTSSDIDGFELDMAWAATPNLTLQGGLAYTKARISDFPETGDCGDYNDVFGAGLSCKGQRAARYPEWTASMVATHEQNTSMGDVYVRGEVYYNDDYYDEVTNLTIIPGATEVNIRAGIRMDNLSLEAYVANLTDEDAPTGGNNIADTSGYVRSTTFAYNFAVESVHIHMRDKREFGLRATYSF